VNATSPLSLLLTRQFALFVLVGGVAALIHWTARILLNLVMDFRVAVIVAYAVGIGTAFLLNKRFVFPDSGRALAGEVRYFVLFNVAAFPLVFGASVLLAEQALPWLGFTWHVPEIAHAIAISLPLLVNFFLHKFITFKPQEPDNE
jgi:putative flippase GtrA